jgi:alpha-L-arabinofuranosidase
MDELEFITGPVTSPFGKLRASLGYPKPWKIRYVEIGNEDNLGDQYVSYAAYRFAAFYDAIHAKYPDIICISSTGDTLVQRDSTATDYHQYARPDQFAGEFGYFDNIANKQHLTLIGEYAVIQKNLNGSGVDWSGAEPRLAYPTWVGAVSEAVFSLGAERNGYGIIGASYAPGFQNLNDWQWAVCSPSPLSPTLTYTDQ